jgi:hypothetical protein
MTMSIQTQIPGSLLKQGPQTEAARYARAYLAQRVARYLSITTPRKRAIKNLKAHLECGERTILRLEAQGKEEKRDFEAEHDECPFEIERGFHALLVLAELRHAEDQEHAEEARATWEESRATKEGENGHEDHGNRLRAAEGSIEALRDGAARAFADVLRHRRPDLTWQVAPFEGNEGIARLGELWSEASGDDPDASGDLTVALADPDCVERAA